MGFLRDILWTLVVLSLVVVGVAAIPFLAIIGFVIAFAIVGYVIYAHNHDARLEREAEEREKT